MPHRTPEQIIGDDAFRQLVFEGYTVVPASAVRPFQTFAADNVDENGWKSSIHREPISYWFGPRDFQAIKS